MNKTELKRLYMTFVREYFYDDVNVGNHDLYVINLPRIYFIYLLGNPPLFISSSNKYNNNYILYII